MTKIVLKSLLAGSASCATLLAISSAAVASQSGELVQPVVEPQATAPLTMPVSQPTLISDASVEQLNRYSGEGAPGGNVNPMAQVNSVSQLSDVKPTDWAFAALQSLVEKYGCVVGYPDRTYRGQRALSRYEFAAGLNACLDRISELIASSTANLVTKEDLAVVRKLQEEFAAELATLRGRVDALEAKTAQLEAQQFSTTTKLSGEAIFALTGEFGGSTNGVDRGSSIALQNRVRLAFNTSFTGKDLLVSRIAAGSSPGFPDGLGGVLTEANQGFQGLTGNAASVDWVAYYFPVGDNAKFMVSAFGSGWNDLVPTLNPYDGQSLSAFGERNPIYSVGGGTGLVFNYSISPLLTFSAGYLAPSGVASSTASGAGLTDGDYSALFQATLTPSRNSGVAVTYVTAERSAGQALFGSGTQLTNLGGLVGSTADVYGLSAFYQFSPQFALNGFATYAEVGYDAPVAQTGEVYSYGLGFSFPDLGKKGSLGGLILGVQPYLDNVSTVLPASAALGSFDSPPFHVEAFYKYQLTDNISVTPGVIWVSTPFQSATVDDAFVGTIKTTFTF
ncbi:MAG: iron uptake porin [Cyanobacteria bacterium LVE1205-1]